MKQRTVIQVGMHCEKCRVKAMQIAVSFSGVESASAQVEKNQIEVVGNGVDVVKLTTLLKKKLGFAKIESMGNVEVKKPEEKKDEGKKPQITMNPAVVWPSSNIGHVMHHCACDDQPSCAIL